LQAKNKKQKIHYKDLTPLHGTKNTLKNYEDKELPPFVART
jgi:hypothetical protein